MRWIEAIPFEKEGQQMVILRDDEEISEQPVAVSRETFRLLSLMDGTRTLRDVQADYMRVSGSLILTEHLERLLEQMDGLLLLENERYAQHVAKLREEYERSPLRPSSLAGKSYPENRMDLLAYLDEMFGRSRGQATSMTDRIASVPFAEGSLPPSGSRITGLLAPHIDYDRGSAVYRQTYPCLRRVETPLMVVIGTCHQPAEKIWNISLKDFATPIDVAPCSREMTELIREDRVLRDYVCEWPHRREHSVELQLPLIQFNVLGGFEILPIVTGSMHEYVEGSRDIGDGEITDLVESLAGALERYGRPYTIISGADLAHIGLQFGDSYPSNRFVLEESKERDQAILDSINEVDADRFFETIRSERDGRRICGLAPIYFQLRLLAGDRCIITDYGQWTDGNSSVSFAGGVFYR